MVAVDTMKRSQQNKTGHSHGKNESAQCTRKRSYQNNAYEVTSKGVVVHPDHVLVKTSTDNSLADAQMIEVPGAYTHLR